MSSAAGWYSDPSDPGKLQRYWDGASWTVYTRPLGTPAGPASVQPTAGPGNFATGGAFADPFRPAGSWLPDNNRYHVERRVGFRRSLRSFFDVGSSGTGGRAPVDQWVWTHLVISPVFTIIYAIAAGGMLSYVRPKSDEYEMSDTGAAVAILTLLVVAVCVFLQYIQLFCVSVRRLHDTGRSGFYLFISMIPLVGSLVLLYWLLSRGDSSRNRFDSEPGRSFWWIAGWILLPPLVLVLAGVAYGLLAGGPGSGM